MNNPAPRAYPELRSGLPEPRRPISFVCLRYSSQFEHNIIKSEAVIDPMNEFIVVDNPANVFFDTLGQAILSGLKHASHDLVLIVHEDLLLRPGWQAQWEQSLASLEAVDPDWGIVGVLGWDAEGELQGHNGGPWGVNNTMEDKDFLPVSRIDEQLIAFRQSRAPRPDPNLPSIHNVGRDLPRQAAAAGAGTYVVNAPPIHKYADGAGAPVLGPKKKRPGPKKASPLTAWRDVSDEFLRAKWEGAAFDAKAKSMTATQEAILSSPDVLIAPAGATQAGWDGSPVDPGESFVAAMYRTILRRHRCPDRIQMSANTGDLRQSARRLLKQRGWPDRWAFHVRGSELAIADILAAFPEARIRAAHDPFVTTGDELELADRLADPIYQTLCREAYDWSGKTRQSILDDGAEARAAVVAAFRTHIVAEQQARAEAEAGSREGT